MSSEAPFAVDDLEDETPLVQPVAQRVCAFPAPVGVHLPASQARQMARRSAGPLPPLPLRPDQARDAVATAAAQFESSADQPASPARRRRSAFRPITPARFSHAPPHVPPPAIPSSAVESSPQSPVLYAESPLEEDASIREQPQLADSGVVLLSVSDAPAAAAPQWSWSIGSAADVWSAGEGEGSEEERALILEIFGELI